MKRVGLLFHGPEVLDEKEAEEAIERLNAAGFGLEAALGGITGKTAVIDAGLQHVIDIHNDRRPSEVVADYVNRGLDFIILLNHAKAEESGFVLGEGILRNYTAQSDMTLSFVQLEYSSRIIIPWLVKAGDERLYKQVTGVFSEFEEREPYMLESRCKKELNVVYRVIKGVHPGEKIVVDGVVVGVSTQSENHSVTLVAEDGKLVKIVGGTLITHNLEKLPPIDLEKEMIKTGKVIRRTKPEKVRLGEEASEGGRRKKACIFCTVENIFPKIVSGEADIALAVTIGDDTTSIAGDILKRFGIRMIGITDGDADGLIEGIQSGALEEYRRFLPHDSLILRLKPERDDSIGRMVKNEIFHGAEEIDLIGDVEMHLEDLKQGILNLAKEDIIDVLSSALPTTEKAKNL